MWKNSAVKIVFMSSCRITSKAPNKHILNFFSLPYSFSFSSFKNVDISNLNHNVLFGFFSPLCDNGVDVKTLSL